MNERLAALRAKKLLPAFRVAQQGRVVDAALRALPRPVRIDGMAIRAHVGCARRVPHFPGVLSPQDIGAALGAWLRAGKAIAQVASTKRQAAAVVRRPVLFLTGYSQVGETIFNDLTVKVFAAFLLSSVAAGAAGFSVPAVPTVSVAFA